MRAPVFTGDTLRTPTEIIALRDSKSRPDAGIIAFGYELFNQHDELVCECLRIALILKRPV
jgi:acyl dehydratase